MRPGREALIHRIEEARRRLERLRERADRDAVDPPQLHEALEELGQTLEELSVTAEDLDSTAERLGTANEQLAASQLEAVRLAHRYAELFRQAPDAYVVTDALGVIREVNDAAEERLGRARRYLIDKPLVALVAAADRDALLDCLTAMRRDGRHRIADLPLRFGSGSPLFEASVSAAVEAGEGALEVRWMLRDVSRQRILESQLRAASMAAVVAEDRERRRLAADLHDDVSQLLTLAGMKLGLLRQETGGDEQGEVRLGEIAELLRSAHQRTESLSFQLSPPMLHDMGFAAAAEWLAEEMERTYGLRVSVEHGEETPLDEKLRIMLFRGLRELLINVARHAGSDEASVHIASDAETLTVVVEDSGAGFDEQAAAAGFGLLSLRDRLEGFGGRLDIQSRAKRGTRVQMVAPLAPDPDASRGAP